MFLLECSSHEKLSLPTTLRSRERDSNTPMVFLPFLNCIDLTINRVDIPTVLHKNWTLMFSLNEGSSKGLNI